MELRAEDAGFSLVNSSDKPMFNVPRVANSVICVELLPSVTGTFATLRAAGDDTNIGLAVRSKGTGGLSFYVGSTLLANVNEFALKLASSKVLSVNNVTVVRGRFTGWAVDTGTAKRTANATYAGTAEAAYTQATIQALMDKVRDLSQTIKALKDDLHGTAGHGLIGT